MKKYLFLALVLCLSMSTSIFADGQTHAGGRSDCPPQETCLASTPETTSTGDSSLFENLISGIVNIVTGG